jgi:hypothetical protein
MKRMDHKEGLEALRRAGLTGLEIERLCQLRQAYTQNALEQARVDLSRLKFIRWLVANGRLSEQIA